MFPNHLYSPKLSPWLEKHGPDGTRDVCIEGVDSDGQPTTFNFTLHEDRLDDYPGPGHNDACLDICTEFAELIVANLLDRLGDLDKLSGVRMFTPDSWPHDRHERLAKCQEWLESLITLFRADESEEIVPGYSTSACLTPPSLPISFAVLTPPSSCPYLACSPVRTLIFLPLSCFLPLSVS
ncbi:unnamed protein product [Closterium sp. Naga37s-1]|nr:unnamed protein product [Closterium sp. Naga37s-1]